MYTQKKLNKKKVEIPPQILLFLKLGNGEMSSLWQVVFKNKQTKQNACLMTTQSNIRTLNNYSTLLFSNLQMHVQNLDAKIKNCYCENWNLEHWSKISQGNKPKCN